VNAGRPRTAHAARTARAARGVTLIELLTVVGIVGLLAAIGYPLYLEQTAKGRRANAKAMLNQVMQQQERHYAANRTYAASLADLGFGPGPTWYTDNNTHTLTVGTCPPPNDALQRCVQVTATAAVPDAKCTSLTLASNFARSATGSQPAICW
jgi:type IV pilus assembly protein PilE